MVPPDGLEDTDEDDDEEEGQDSPDAAPETKTPERPCAHDSPPSTKEVPNELGTSVDSPLLETASDSVEPSAPKKEEEAQEDDDDPEMAPVYLRRLLPLFAGVYQTTVFGSVR